MPTFTSPSGKEYQWNNPNPPTKADIDALVAYDSQLSGQPQSQGPATIAEMRRREEAGQVSALTPAQVQAQVGSPQQLEQAVQDSGKVGMMERFGKAIENLPWEYGQLADPVGMLAPMEGGRIAPSGELTPLAQAEARGMMRGTAMGARAIPALLAAPASSGASIPAMMGTGALASAIGEAVGQTIEKLFGIRQDVSGREIAASAVTGAAPIIPGGGFLKPLANIAMQGAGGVAGEAVRTGEFEPGAGIVPAALTAGFQIPGAIAGRAGAGFERAAERAATVERIGEGVQPTFGQAMPRFAGLESRIESRAGMPPITEQLARQGEQIKTAVQKLTGVAAEGADTVTQKLLGALSANEIDDIANASRNLKDAETILESARGQAQKQAQQRAVDQALQAYQDTVKNTLFKGQNISAFRVVPAGQQIESLADQAKTAIKAEANRIYGPANAVENDQKFNLFKPVGNNPSFAAQANELLAQIPDIHASGLKEARKLLSRTETMMTPSSMDPTRPVTVSVPQKASLKELKDLRDELYDFADYAGEAIGSGQQRQVKNLATTLSQTIADQAPEAIGAEAAAARAAGDEFYAATRPKLNLFGVRRAFAPETMERGQLGQAMVSGVKAQGLLAPEFANVESLVNTLKSRGVANAPDLQDVYSSIRSGIVSDATDKATGAIDYKKLAGTINNLETQSPGALEKVGLGSKDQLSKFVNFLESTGQKTGPQALLDILQTKTPAGFAVASEAVQLLPNVKDVGSVVRYLEREAVAGNKLAKEALISTRAREIEDILLAETVLGGKGPNLKGVFKINRAEQILGPTLYKQIVDDIIPGYKTILMAERAAGGGGALVSGQAAEELVAGIPQSALKVAAGKPVEGIMGVIGTAVNAGFYNVAAKALARASGSAGYRSAADTARIFEKFSNIPRASLYDALSKYADTGELPK
jgi:hypothetical protein